MRSGFEQNPVEDSQSTNKVEEKFTENLDHCRLACLAGLLMRGDRFLGVGKLVCM